MIAGILRRIGQRRLLVLLDQAASGLSNVIVTIMVARLVGSEEFGAFGVAVVVFQMVLSSLRALVGEPWLSAHSTDDGPTRTRVAADLVAAAFVAAVVASAIVATGAVLLGGAATGALLALALALPVVSLQDSLRYVAAVDHPQLALASDLVWLAAIVALLLAAPQGATAAWFMAAWGVSAAAGLAVAVATMRIPWTSGSAIRWFRRHRVMAGSYFADVASARLAGDVTQLGLGVIAGLPALGAVRAVYTFFGPLNTMFAGIFLVVVPDGARARDEPAKLVRLMAAATALVTGAAVTWLAVGVLLPDDVGRELFGATWTAAQDVMLAVGLVFVAESVFTGGFAGLRSLGDGPRSLRARLLSLPPQTLGALGGAAVGGAVGYGVGLTIGTAVKVLIWWSSFATALRHRQAKHMSKRRGRRARAGDGRSKAAHRHSETAA